MEKIECLTLLMLVLAIFGIGGTVAFLGEEGKAARAKIATWIKKRL